MNDSQTSGASAVLWLTPVAAIAWVIAFLLTPDLRPLREPGDAVAPALLASLLAVAWWGIRYFYRSGMAGQFDRARSRSPLTWGASALLAAMVYPVVMCALGKYYWVHVGALTLIYVILTIGLNVVVGFAGLLVLGFAAFYGIGAYIAAILSSQFPGMPHLIWLLIPVAAGVSAIFGVLLGAPTLKLRGDYLAIVTMGFGEIVRIIFTNWDGLTRGPIGISDIAPLKIWNWDLSQSFRIGSVRIDSAAQYYVMLLCFAAFFCLMAYRLNLSRYGRAWAALRQDELAAGCFGIDAARFKLLAFAMAAACAGVAGVFFASIQGFIDPTSFTFMESVLILCMVVMGGMGSLSGGVAAAMLLVMIPEKLQMIREYRMLIFGLLMIVLMIVRPQGLIPSRRRLRELRGSPV